MDSSNGPTGQFFRFICRHSRRLGWIVVSAGLIFQALLLISHMSAYAAGSDSSGYMNMARLLSNGQSSITRRSIDPDPAHHPLTASDDYTFVPLGFRPARNGEMVPTYPLGLPLLIAGASTITGWLAAPGIVVGSHALMTLVLLFLLSRAWGLPRGWSVFGALILAGCPLILMFSIQTMSDVPAMAWVLASIFLTWKSRARAAIALGAGFAVGIAVLIRPTNVLVVISLLPLLGMRWRQWILVAMAGLPFALLFCGYNYAAYGSPFETGYGSVYGLLSSHHILPTLKNYARWLPALLTPFLLLVPAIMWMRAVPVAIRASIVLWIIAFLGFYVFYEPTHEAWWYLRFTLPAFPGLVLAVLLTGHSLTERTRFRLLNVRGSWCALTVSVLLIAAVIFNSRYWSKKLYPFASQDDERQYYDASQWAAMNLPDDAVVASLQLSGSLFFYTHFPIVRWDTLDANAHTDVDLALRRSNRPFYLVELEQESLRALQEYLPGSWREVARIRNVRVLKREEPSHMPPAL